MFSPMQIPFVLLLLCGLFLRARRRWVTDPMVTELVQTSATQKAAEELGVAAEADRVVVLGAGWRSARYALWLRTGEEARIAVGAAVTRLAGGAYAIAITLKHHVG